jgi:hypothetical protein
MKILKKLKTLFNKNVIGDYIDLLYSIMGMWMLYYSTFVLVVGLFYLSDVLPSNILKNICGEIPHEFIGATFEKGTFSQSIMLFFTLWITFNMVILMFKYCLHKESLYSIFEILVGYSLVNIGIYFDPVVTPDIIIKYVCWFMVIKLALMAVTRIFKISTRHFGYFMEIECPPIELAVKKSISDEDTGTKEE